MSMQPPGSSQTATSPTSHNTVVTDLTVIASATISPDLDPQIWHRIEKDLCLHTSSQQIWLYVARSNEEDLAPEDPLVLDIAVGDSPPDTRPWEHRPGGIWLLRGKASGITSQPVTEVDVLFGVDAVDPRPQWVLMRSSLQLDSQSEARLSVLHGRPNPTRDPPAVLKVEQGGSFKIVQFSDFHMVTGPGLCRDAIDEHGQHMAERRADPLTVDFIGRILDAEEPDLVILTGDQLHHGVPDSQSALFKAVAPIIQRSIPFAAVFGNHDSEGEHALSREAQMSILQNLPFSLCEPGPEHVDGVGNFYLEVLAPAPSQGLLLLFLDSHGEVPSDTKNPDYDHIKQSQIDWLLTTCQARRAAHEKGLLPLVFQHIPIPEYGDPRLRIHRGRRGEPPETPSTDLHFYDALVKGGVAAFSCGHDHVNDFVALLPQQQDGETAPHHDLWLLYAGCSGFGGYCSYEGQRYHRGARVLEYKAGLLKTWRRVEYAADRVDELVLVKNG